ncbi:hypothetical protein SPRG_06177 [Saprolegnia parasitica CBS 223.65]|uniref:YbaK/aminoacyl-tRNA synthetase-associated domain-containing protein n=1 Tax=Saprolegnia parasitica (strain CBS 223.65) TaxID=695850 RepID=A0A067CRH2_SAPPC|nr:hypothetical protein SPRG_06177 [Saprolegnia parasitica CBS 223.65]KDO29121.1 hypothetical protein SPRG_06177 [Saprolegnia parasitica CBS 223.65]|eukprot:XP_012200287.1 hypothetical protein SPRG_06177 [Saprolegnia parasitica CBS 223.65]
MNDNGVATIEARAEALEQRVIAMENVARVVQHLRKEQVASAALHTAPAAYYDWSLAQRAQLLNCKTSQLCKSIIMENVAWKAEMVHAPRYVCVIVQYEAKVNADKVAKLVRDAGKDAKVSRKHVNFQHAATDVSDELTGFQFNGVSPFGMKTSIPVVVSSAILPLGYVWLGGGAVDVKLRASTADIVRALDALVGDISEPRV